MFLAYKGWFQKSSTTPWNNLVKSNKKNLPATVLVGMTEYIFLYSVFLRNSKSWLKTYFSSLLLLFYDFITEHIEKWVFTNLIFIIILSALIIISLLALHEELYVKHFSTTPSMNGLGMIVYSIDQFVSKCHKRFPVYVTTTICHKLTIAHHTSYIELFQ